MKRLFFFILLFSLTINLYSQDSVTFINTLGEKERAAIGDAVTLFMHVTGRTPRGFQQVMVALKDAGVVTQTEYDQNAALRRGMLARMVARQMNLRGSLLYILFGTERYAYSACISEGVMDPGGSEWDILTGEELIETLSRMSEAMEETR